MSLPYKTWLVHDWLTGMRGGEKVLLELTRLLPNSRIATLIHVPGTTHPDLDIRVARTSFLNRRRHIAKTYRNYLPLFPQAIRSIKLDPADLVVSVSHAVAKGVTLPDAHTPHLCYCNTPMRYIWGMEDQYLPRWNWKRAALAAVKPYLRRFDLQNDAVDQFVANSKNVQERIGRIYDRESAVVYPGVDEQFWTPAEPDDQRPLAQPYWLVVSALVPYKRVDLAVAGFLRGQAQGVAAGHLVIIGDGTELERLKSAARGDSRVVLLGRQRDEEVRRYYRHCEGFLFCGEEDFGLTPVEAMACGRPIVAYRRGGVTETVTEQTGVFFEEQSPEAVAHAIEACAARPWDAAVIRERALGFTWRNFAQGMKQVIEGLMGRKAGL